jgi:serine/threonine-protein kinase
MALSAGTRIGSYEVTGALGAGGMGEVYRARDTKLGRDVALKVLPEAFASDPDRLARFRREAQLLASLNHPHIAAIHGLEEGDVPAIVLELVEGPTLADRIKEGALALEDALRIARQVADALDAAHERGVIHRDLKPANIKVREDGTVKVLDFGLAKAFDDGPSHVSGATQSPTLTSPAVTRAGVILGTAAYMAPEQARGKSVDKRADIWAFGVVLFEMLTGRRAFAGDEVSDTLAFVLAREPEWTAMPPSVSPVVRRLLRRCLEKDRSKRLADIADARLEIDDALSMPPEATTTVASAAPPVPRWRRALPWSVAAAALISTGGTLALWAPWRTPQPNPVVRVTADVGADVSVAGAAPLAMSPDGSILAFTAVPGRADPAVSQPQLHIRRMGDLTASPVPGATPAIAPFFSPDGQWVAFASGGVLKKVLVSGGALVTLTESPMFRGGWWAEDDTIVFTSSRNGGAIMRVSAAGGDAEEVIAAGETGAGYSRPQVLPGGRGLVFAAVPDSGVPEDASIMVQSLPPDGEPRVLQQGGYFPRYLSSGHLTWMRGGTLFAAPFSLDSLQLTGAPVPVLDQIITQAFVAGAAAVSVSASGALAFLPGEGGGVPNQGPLLWLDRTGTSRPLRATPAAWGNPAFSPDGSRVAVTIFDGRQADIWIYDWGRDTLTRLTTDPANDAKPVWTPDGTRIAFGSTRAGATNLYWQRADGTGAVERLTESPEPQLADSFHPSGRFLALHQGNPVVRMQSIQILPLEGSEASGWKPGTPVEFRRGGSIMANPMFSPDGRWIAYASLESGQSQIYVQSFPDGAGRWQVSSAGGNVPVWSRTRSELFYTTASGEDQMMVVPYTVDGDTFRPGRAERWSEAPFSGATPYTSYGPGVDLHPDGERFVVAPARSGERQVQQRQLVFVFNFFDELRRLAPPTR